ncbi:MAG TPA: class I SAM-dependent methyltransferase [Candidatus Tectomicrobia bacterium]|nr:class I SAM-dependent methyltransferase [Candidatus Tectomicrobia bacterium]
MKVYDRIGRGYTATRRADPRIAAAIGKALGPATTVIDVGAGAGSYEPEDVRVVAVEPSRAMIRQRARPTPVVQAVAEALPFADGAFDAALAILTVHHWSDRRAGLAECARVARDRVVVLTWDPAAREAFWLTTEYLPAILDLDVPRFPSMAELAAALGTGTLDVHTVPIPADCVDGFMGAYWRRPEAYLDPQVRRGMSSFAQLPPALVQDGLARLAEDLSTGRWDARFGALRTLEEIDLGYRLVTARR